MCLMDVPSFLLVKSAREHPHKVKHACVRCRETSLLQMSSQNILVLEVTSRHLVMDDASRHLVVDDVSPDILWWMKP